MFTMSCLLRFTSPGLPAPSMTIASYSAARESKASFAAAKGGFRSRVYSQNSRFPTGFPRTITWEPVSLLGLSRTGFIRTSGSIRQAWAWTTCARPISPPSRVTKELSDMFCALNGATRRPSWRRIRQSAAARTLLPAFEPVPWNMITGVRRGAVWPCASERLPEGAAEAAVLLGRPHGDAEEPPVETGEVVADADGDPVGEEALGQFGGVDVAAVDPDEEEVRRPRIDGKPRDRPELRGELLAPRAHEAARRLRILAVAEGRRADGLGEGVDRPGGRQGAEPPDDLPLGDGGAQAEARDRVELGERPEDDEIGRPLAGEEALLPGEVGEGLVDDEDRRGVAGGEFPEGAGGKERARGVVRPAQDDDLIPRECPLRSRRNPGRIPAPPEAEGAPRSSPASSAAAA